MGLEAEREAICFCVSKEFPASFYLHIRSGDSDVSLWWDGERIKIVG